VFDERRDVVDAVSAARGSVMYTVTRPLCNFCTSKREDEGVKEPDSVDLCREIEGKLRVKILFSSSGISNSICQEYAPLKL
jgi:hypothetical protein